MNKKLYKKLLGFRSHSKSEEQIQFREWLQAYIESTYDNVLTHVDTYGNLYVHKSSDNEYDYVNCVVAHLDINQKTKTDDFSIVEVGGFIIGINNEDGNQIGLGHDDKTGVYFALKALHKFDNIKVFFPLDEEIGLVGTKASVDEFFGDVGFFLQLDRRGYSDISDYTNGHKIIELSTKKEFEKLLCRHNFNWTNTVSTDIGYLTERHMIQGTNISCGYKNEHTDKETFNILRYENSERFAMAILKLTDNKYYPLDIPVKVVNTASNYSSTLTNSVTNTTSTKSVESSSTVKSNSNTIGPILKDDVDEKKKLITALETEYDELDYAIESLYDIPMITHSDAIEFHELCKEILEKFYTLEEGYDRDMLYIRLYLVLSDIEYGLQDYPSMSIQKLVDSMTPEYERINNDYPVTDYEDVNSYDVDYQNMYH